MRFSSPPLKCLKKRAHDARRCGCGTCLRSPPREIIASKYYGFRICRAVSSRPISQRTVHASSAFWLESKFLCGTPRLALHSFGGFSVHLIITHTANLCGEQVVDHQFIFITLLKSTHHELNFDLVQLKSPLSPSPPFPFRTTGSKRPSQRRHPDRQRRQYSHFCPDGSGCYRQVTHETM